MRNRILCVKQMSLDRISRLAAGGQTLCVSIADSQINSVRLTYGHHNPLKMLQDGNYRLAQNILNLLNLRNYRVTRELANLLIISRNANGVSCSNPLNRLDYNESLELANSLKMFQTPNMAAGLHDGKSLFLFHTPNSGSGQNNVKRGSEISTNFVGSCNGSAFLLYEENQQPAVLQRNPYLAYERGVTKSYEVNRLSLSESDNKPSLRWEILHTSLRVAQNRPEIIVAVGYRQICRLVNGLTGSNPVQLSGSDLAFLRRCFNLFATDSMMNRIGARSGAGGGVGLSAMTYSWSLGLRRCSSSRATPTSCRISSPAFMPISSTRASASMEDKSGFSVAPSVCRLAISLRTAVIINCARDSPLARDESISLTTSCGKRALICCDLLFVELVTGIHPLMYCEIQHNIQMNTKKSLQCDSLLNNVNTIIVINCDSVVKSKARQCSNTNRASNHNVIGGNDNG